MSQFRGIHIYSRSGSTWSWNSEFLIAAPSSASHVASISDDGNYIIAIHEEVIQDGSPYFQRHRKLFSNVYVRSGSTWSLQQSISFTTASGSGLSYSQGLEHFCSINSTGTYFTVSCFETSKVYIYSRSGSTWSLQQTITYPDAVNDLFYDPNSSYTYGFLRIAMNTTGDRLICGITTSQFSSSPVALYVYARSGTTWALENIFKPSTVSGYGSSSGYSFGFDSSGKIVTTMTYGAIGSNTQLITQYQIV